MDTDSIDFHLVSTYFPLLLLITRSVLLVTIHALVVALLPYCVFGISSVLVYVDYITFSDNLSNTVGFLLAIGVALEVNRCSESLCMNVYARIGNWVVDIVWAVSSSVHVCYALFRIHPPPDIIMILFWSGCFISNSTLACSSMLPGEIMGRASLYYTTCMLHSYTRGKKISVNTRMTPHIALHMLFVEPYVLIGSVLVFTAIFVRVFTSSSVGKNSDTTKVESRQSKNNTFHSSSDDDLAQLRRAQGLMA